MNNYPLFRVRSWNNGVRCMSFYISMGICFTIVNIFPLAQKWWFSDISVKHPHTIMRRTSWWRHQKRKLLALCEGNVPVTGRSPGTKGVLPGTKVCRMLLWRTMMTSANGYIFRVTGPLCVRVIHRLSVNSPHKAQWRRALTFSLICLNKQWRKQSRRRWLETPSRSLCRYCNMYFHCP